MSSLSPPGQPPPIPSADWWITSHCNLACDFCYGPVPDKDPLGLRDSILRAIAASSARTVTFCGGEPLLVRPADGYAAVLRSRGKSTVLNTNGEFLRRRHDQGFRLDAFTMVGISIEGSTLKVHRAMRGGKADFDETIEAARLVAKQSDVSLKLATVVSAVNRADLPALARIVRDLAPVIWRLYQYSSRGDVNTGQRRHRLPDGEFRRLASQAADLAAPVPTAPATEDDTEGCLIIGADGRVLQPFGRTYLKLGNCLREPLDDIWAKSADQEAIIRNKRWLPILR